MIYLRHKNLFFISGLVWLSVGLFLMGIGLNFFIKPLFNDAIIEYNYPLILMFSNYIHYSIVIFLVILLALVIGYFKGKYILRKSAKRGVDHILTLPNPASLIKIYSAKYYILLISMIGIGMLMKYLSVPTDIRGFIDIAVGTALINGSLFYFKRGFLEYLLFDNLIRK